MTQVHGFAFRDLPRFSLPAAMSFFGRPTLRRGKSQFGCLHLGHRTGRPSMRLIQVWLQRRHLQIMAAGIGICSHDSRFMLTHNIFS